ncbi:hypothetical protein ASPZODRAFT_18363 [Penicilliopsis zonata CBS 506.65]|uniref:Small EDRK-rich factor-like N-terminal domain-containing protein n=1 Tax=Penicilliopsis zonata CBS 506.65 TaxID=1073090 RepID=A0A1L9SCH9_9EURO|nr:hypothetical protein ASPZODRAFT_18363 [Penicilliopsis zonata CBS 506.65]OJJ44797.1 hypothetical protein ASPZODRAFT_18363 [Penicilliopsis zonata CBS 506.65]
MTRGNQRDSDRKKQQAKAAKDGKKHKNSMTGTEFQRNKEDVAAIMREKQKLADERRAAEGNKK